MNPQDPREVPTARKRSWPPPSSDVAVTSAARRDPLHESLATLLRTQRSAGGQAPLPIVSRVVSGMLRRLPTMQVANDAPSDVYGASVILWESLAGRPFAPRTAEDHEPASRYRVHLDPAVDAIVAKGLGSGSMNRFETPGAMAVALEALIPPATPTQIGAWVESLARESLDELPAPHAAVEAAPLPEVRPPADAIAAEPPFAPTRAEVLPPASAPVRLDEPSIEIRLDPGLVDGAKLNAITRRVRSRPPPPIRRIASSPPAGRHVVLALAIAGMALLVVVCVRWLAADRPSPPVAAPVKSTASAPSPETPRPAGADDVPQSASFTVPVVPSTTSAAAPRTTAGAAAGNAPARAPKAKRAQLSRDDVL